MGKRGLENKRAMSEIITTLILIVLVLIAIGVVWAVISKIISSGSEKITEERFKLNLTTQNLTGGSGGETGGNETGGETGGNETGGETGGDGEDCIPESSDTTCGEWLCGNKTNNCGDLVDCGICESGECVSGTCESCTPDCTERECGSDGCGDNTNCGTCESGTCVGGSCVIETSLNTGIVQDVWPPEIALYFASSDLPTDTTYTNYYAKFPGSLETRCLIIYDYLWPLEGYNKTIVRLGSYNSVHEGDTYQIWETYAGCSDS